MNSVAGRPTTVGLSLKSSRKHGYSDCDVVVDVDEAIDGPVLAPLRKLEGRAQGLSSLPDERAQMRSESVRGRVGARLSGGFLYILDRALAEGVNRDDLRALVESIVDRSSGLVVTGDEASLEPLERVPLGVAISDPRFAGSSELESGWRSLFEGPQSLTAEMEAQAKLAVAPGPVLVEGGIGVGKTHFARSLRGEMQRQGLLVSDAPVVLENFGSVREESVDGLLRGVAESAFTGVKARAGVFEQAHLGVLALDDFQNATLASQVRLLDILDPASDLIREPARHGSAVKGGNGDPFRVKTLLVVNQPIAELVRKGRLRSDVLSRVRTVIRLSGWEHVRRSDERQARMLVRRFMIKHGPRARRREGGSVDWHFAVPQLSRWSWRFDREAWKMLIGAQFEDGTRGLERLIADLCSRDDLCTEMSAERRHFISGHLGCEYLGQALATSRRRGRGDEHGERVAVRPLGVDDVAGSRRAFSEILLAIGEACGWEQKAMERHLRPVRRGTVRKFIRDRFPEVLAKSPWPVDD
jgi:hypothetical protein